MRTVVGIHLQKRNKIQPYTKETPGTANELVKRYLNKAYNAKPNVKHLSTSVPSRLPW